MLLRSFRGMSLFLGDALENSSGGRIMMTVAFKNDSVKSIDVVLDKTNKVKCKVVSRCWDTKSS